jgi:hypothetical protein
MTCHPQQYADWSHSMHANASDDPVFLAMNQRAVRETNGQLGNFCVKCHAPVAVSEGLTTDGHELPTLQPAYKGVTCYFCHAATAVADTHNNPIALARDDSFFGPFGDPVAGMPHRGTYSPLLDSSRVESASFCGSCHDIVNQHGAAVERTFQEWQGTTFADPKSASANTCASCHMPPPTTSPGPASTVSTRARDLHSHEMPGVDLTLTDATTMQAQRPGVQAQLDTVVQSSVCFDSRAMKIWVTLDNVAAGHGFPSGATPDRRAWVEVQAFSGSTVIFQSGVSDGTAPGTGDPDLWLMRDCIYDDAGNPVTMFWQAAAVTPSSLPGTVTLTVSDPSTFTKTHIKKIYPADPAVIASVPDRITVKVHLKAIGDDVLADLVSSHDLDAAVAAQVPTFDLGYGGQVEWTPSTARPAMQVDPTGALSCVVTGGGAFKDTPNLAMSHASCAMGRAP